MVLPSKKYVQKHQYEKHLTQAFRTLECTPLLTGG